MIAPPEAAGEVNGWLCPDDYRAVPRIRIEIDGRHETTMECTLLYPSLKDWSWHETGICGFAINEATLPGLHAVQRLEIFDCESNVLLYRRVPMAAPVDRKLLLVSTGPKPEAAIQNALFERFQVSYFNVENMAEETLATLMGNAKTVPSIVMAGNVVMPRQEDLCAHSGIETAILIRDPYESLAVQLDGLRRAAATLDTQGQSWRFAHLSEAIAFARSFDPLDRRAGRRSLRNLAESVYRQLANPLTRQLGTKQAGGTVGPDNAAVAIEVLSRLNVVGHARYYDAFVAMLFDHLATDAPRIEPDTPSAQIQAAAQVLREDGAAEFLIEHDLRLSEAVAAIIAKQWSA